MTYEEVRELERLITVLNAKPSQGDWFEVIRVILNKMVSACVKDIDFRVDDVDE